MAKKHAKKLKITASKPKSTARPSKKDQTIELSLPAEFYDKIAKLEEANLTSILTSVLAKKARVAIKKEGIKHIKISRRPEVRGIAPTGMKRLQKKCS